MPSLRYVVRQSLWMVHSALQLLAALSTGLYWIVQLYRLTVYSFLMIFYFLPHAWWYLTSPNVIRRVSYRKEKSKRRKSSRDSNKKVKRLDSSESKRHAWRDSSSEDLSYRPPSRRILPSATSSGLSTVFLSSALATTKCIVRHDKEEKSAGRSPRLPGTVQKEKKGRTEENVRCDDEEEEEEENVMGERGRCSPSSSQRSTNTSFLKNGFGKSATLPSFLLSPVCPHAYPPTLPERDGRSSFPHHPHQHLNDNSNKSKRNKENTKYPNKEPSKRKNTSARDKKEKEKDDEMGSPSSGSFDSLPWNSSAMEFNNRAKLDIVLPVPFDVVMKALDDKHHLRRSHRRRLRRKKFPIVILVTGGAWIIGSQMWSTMLARVLASRGYVVFCPDYRNFPQATMEGMTLDVSDAISWVLRNAERYNGDLEDVTLMGQSAGAHLTMMSLLSQAQLSGYKAKGGKLSSLPPPSSVAYNVSRYNPRASIHRYVALSGIYNVEAQATHFHQKGLNRSLLYKIAGGKENMPRYSINSYFDPCRLADTREVLPDNFFDFLPQKMYFLHGDADETNPVQDCASLVMALRSTQYAFLLERAKALATRREHEMRSQHILPGHVLLGSPFFFSHSDERHHRFHRKGKKVHDEEGREAKKKGTRIGTAHPSLEGQPYVGESKRDASRDHGKWRTQRKEEEASISGEQKKDVDDKIKEEELYETEPRERQQGSAEVPIAMDQISQKQVPQVRKDTLHTSPGATPEDHSMEESNPKAPTQEEGVVEAGDKEASASPRGSVSQGKKEEKRTSHSFVSISARDGIPASSMSAALTSTTVTTTVMGTTSTSSRESSSAAMPSPTSNTTSTSSSHTCHSSASPHFDPSPITSSSDPSPQDGHSPRHRPKEDPVSSSSPLAFSSPSFLQPIIQITSSLYTAPSAPCEIRFILIPGSRHTDPIVEECLSAGRSCCADFLCDYDELEVSLDPTTSLWNTNAASSGTAMMMNHTTRHLPPSTGVMGAGSGHGSVMGRSARSTTSPFAPFITREYLTPRHRLAAPDGLLPMAVSPKDRGLLMQLCSSVCPF